MEDRELESAGETIEHLLGQLASLPDRRAREWAEKLVQVVTDLYGEGLRRLIEVAGPEALGHLTHDELVGGLLVLHGLHPESLQRRSEEAVAGIDGVGSVTADETSGTVVLQLAETGSALEKKVRSALESSVPDALHVVVDGPAAGSPVQFVKRKNAGVRG
jgi:hypothetical protein